MIPVNALGIGDFLYHRALIQTGQHRLIAGKSSPHLVHPSYRADIDGLRAIAVVSVLVFHAFPGVLRGGFVGVDIFFVISGYLISTIIFSSLQGNLFTFREFYGRRVRRIFPSLVVVLAATFVAGWLLLLPPEFSLLGKHIAGAGGFVSNFVLLGESGYFDEAASNKPLLHLWSLAIEEQFYLVWPLIAWFAWKKRLNPVLIAIALVLVSFAASIWSSPRSPTLDFYGPHTRFWELLIGGLLAKLTLDRAPERNAAGRGSAHVAAGFATDRELPSDSATLCNAFSTVGMLLIVVSVVSISEGGGFPGWEALMPTLGAVLMIAAGPGGVFNRALLSSRAFVFVGSISYPLYLWHWPLLSFARVIEGAAPSVSVRASFLVLSFVLAWATYRFVERPFRFRLPPRFATVSLVGSMVVLLAVGAYTARSDGFPFREATKPVVQNVGDLGHDEFYRYIVRRSVGCTPQHIREHAIPWSEGIRCFQTFGGRPVDIALVGDSHAEHLYIGLLENLGQKNVAVYIQNAPPFMDNNQMKEIFAYVLSDKAIKTVIISAFWRARQHEANEGETFDHAFLQTIGALIDAGKKVYVTDDGPEFSFDPSLCKYSRRLRRAEKCSEDAAAFMSQYSTYMETLMRAKERYPQMILVETNKYFCEDGVCHMGRDGGLWYRDPHHLNIPGSQYIGRLIGRDHPQLLH